jgi:hypothetical protein
VAVGAGVAVGVGVPCVTFTVPVIPQHSP